MDFDTLTGLDGVDPMRDQYLTFVVGTECYGIEICKVTEIIAIQRVTPVPRMPKAIRGVINLRGQVVPVLDVRTRFGMPSRPYDDRTCIIVVDIDAEPVGLFVDKVAEVIDIPTEKIEPRPRLSDRADAPYIQGLGNVEGGVKVLLDVDKFAFAELVNPRAEPAAS